MLVALAFVRVAPVHAFPLEVSVGPSTVTIDLGQSERYCAGAWYGSGYYSYQWYVNDTAVPGANSSLWIFRPSDPFNASTWLSNASWWVFTPPSMGCYIICFSVKDLNTGETANPDFNATLIVQTAVSVSMSPSNVTMEIGQSLTFTENATGGTPPYRFEWYLNYANPPVYVQPSEMNSSWSSWTFIPTSPGTYVVECWVFPSSQTDFEYSFWQFARNSTTSVTVNPASTPDPPRGWSLLFLYMRSGVFSDGGSRPWSSHFPIPL